MEMLMFLVLPAMVWAGVGLTELYNRDGGWFGKWFIGMFLFCMAFTMFLAQVIVCNI